jgi:site-specific recombinase XerD
MKSYKTYTFSSLLAPAMERFVALKRVSGTDYRSQIRLLVYFDDFLVRENINAPIITCEVFTAYLAGLSHLAPRTRHNRICVIRQFCDFLAQGEPRSYVPQSVNISRSKGASRRPYIYTKAQISALLAEASKLPPHASLRAHTYHSLFGLLYTTGIRIGEARALNLTDVYLKNHRLHIRQGKFRKARWLPLSPSTCYMLGRYIDKRCAAPAACDAPLFISLRNTRLSHCTVHATLRSLLASCGIHTGTGPGPRIHDLRHTFAVHRLLKWYRDGTDVNAMLPALSTYMGHVDVRSTHIYLHATPELFAEADKRFHQYYRKYIKSQGN